MNPTALHVLEAFAGGTEHHLQDLVRHVEDYDHVIAVPSVHKGHSTARAIRLARDHGARVVMLEMSRSRRAYRSLSAIAHLGVVIRRVRPDVIHGHSSIGGAVARLAGWTAPIPIVYTPHGVSRSGWAVNIERVLASRADRVIAVSESERRFLLRHRLAAPDRVRVIPNGIDLDAPAPPRPGLRETLGVASDVPLVGCIGRLTWQKAPEVFVAACAHAHAAVPEAHFVLIGSGPLRARVLEAVAEHGLGPNFHLLPALPNAGAAVAELDLFVLPSRFEGGPYTPLEAMRGQTPVLVSDAAGNRDAVTHGVNGLVVAREDVRALGDWIITILRDPRLSESLVRGALDRLDRFDVQGMARATSELYDELVMQRSGRGTAPVQLGVRHGAAVP